MSAPDHFDFYAFVLFVHIASAVIAFSSTFAFPIIDFTIRRVDLRALRNEPWLAAPSGEPSRQATDRLLAAVGLTPPVPSEFEGLGTVEVHVR